MTAYEAETQIIFNKEEGAAEVYTTSIRVYKVLAARGLEPYRIDTSQGKPCGWFYSLPKSAVLLKPAKQNNQGWWQA